MSVLLQAFYDIEILFTVNPTVFEPPPKVRSAVVRLKRNRTDKLPCNETLFFNMVKTGFNQRRKMLRNSLKSLFPDMDLNESIFQKRPEQLSVSDFVYLSVILDKNRNH